MKTKIFIITILFSMGCITAQETKNQKKDDYKIIVVKKDSVNPFMLSDSTVISKNPVLRFVEDIDEETGSKEITNTDINNSLKKFQRLYGGKTLNILFSKKLATNFNNSNDLTLQKSFFNINSSEKSFSFGYNLDNRKGDTFSPLNWVASIGAKIIASNDFATIATGGDLEENNIGFNLKFSFINNGRIGWKTAKGEQSQQTESEQKRDNKFKGHKKQIELNRLYLYDKYNKKVKSYVDNELPTIEFKNKALFGAEALEEIKGIVKEKSDQLLFEMINEEIEFVESNNYFTSIFNSWWTFEAYIPLGDKEYDITPIDANNKPKNVLFYPFNANVSYNFFKQKSNSFSYFAKIKGSVFGNSNIDVNGLTAKEFQSINTTNGTPTLTSPVSAIEVSEFDRFVTTSLKAEVAFFYDETIGFSPSIEQNFGTYSGLNWKLGIPVSLKDKEGKPTVNFELQWRETETLTGSQHLFGFSTSFFFGNLIN